MRNPILPTNIIINIYNSLKGRVKTNNSDFFELILNEYNSSLVCEALFIASPVTYEQLIKLKNGKLINESEILSLYFTLFKYLIRLCSRSTPFGLFASGTLGRIGNYSHLDISNNCLLYTHTRIDMNILCSIASKVVQLNNLHKELIYYKNTSLYKIGKQYRYIESKNIYGRKHYYMMSIKYSRPLELILKSSEHGIKFKDLIKLLLKLKFNESESETYINELIKSQIILSELEPNVIGNDYLRVLIERLENRPLFKDFYSVLKQIGGELDNMNRERNSKDNWHKNYTSIKTLLEKVTTTKIIEKRIFHVDAFRKTIDLILSKELINNISESLQVLMHFNSNPNKGNKLSKFKQAFYERYDTEEIPLTEALDSELGIGYKNVIINSINDSKNSNNNGLNQATKYKYSKLLEANSKKSHEIIIDTNIEYKINISGLPNSFFVKLNYLSNHTEENNVIIDYMMGPTAAPLLGRFCNGNEELKDYVLQLLNDDAAFEPTKIYAEIGHLPQNRIGNILARPHFTDYEISYLSSSLLPNEKVLHIHDLFISIKNDKIILRSKSLNKEVIPRLSSAHNFAQDPLEIYHFLCDLQNQNAQTSYFWNWDFMSTEPFLPRVSYKNVILSLAIWNLNSKEIIKLDNSSVDIAFSNFREYSALLRLPKYVLICFSDNELLIDLEVPECIQLLIKESKKSKFIKLKEFIFNFNDSNKEGNLVGYRNEIILPFLRKPIEEDNNNNNNNKIKKLINKKVDVKRNFPPGSEWVYIKIYTGIAVAEFILTQTIYPILKKLLLRKIIDKWFFVRYNDPKFHLRLRLHITDKKINIGMLEILFASLNQALDEGLIWNISLDTYKREVERYGALNMVLTENIFHQQSKMVIEIISLISGDEYQEFKIPIAIAIVDSLLSSFNENLNSKFHLINDIYNVFHMDFQVDSNKLLREELKDIYRKMSSNIRLFLNSDFTLNQNLKSDKLITTNKIKFLIIKYQKMFSKLNVELAKLNNTIELNRLNYSFIHMIINKLLNENHRKQELYIYCFLHKYYSSELAKIKYN